MLKLAASVLGEEAVGEECVSAQRSQLPRTPQEEQRLREVQRLSAAHR